MLYNHGHGPQGEEWVGGGQARCRESLLGGDRCGDGGLQLEMALNGS